MEKEIKRDFYLKQLIMRKDNGLIKIVTGIRRSESLLPLGQGSDER